MAADNQDLSQLSSWDLRDRLTNVMHRHGYEAAAYRMDPEWQRLNAEYESRGTPVKEESSWEGRPREDYGSWWKILLFIFGGGILWNLIFGDTCVPELFSKGGC